jgi:hypothetical protein
MILWFFQHPRAPLLLAWALGALLALRDPARRPVAAIPLLALLGLGLLALLPGRPAGLSALVDLHGVRPETQWLGLAVLLLLCPPVRRVVPGLRSLLLLIPALPLPGGLDLGAGGLLVAVLGVASGALEPGQPRRGALLGTLLLLTAAAAVDTYSLSLWLAVLRQGLPHDTASLAVDGLAVALGLAGWLVAMGLSQKNAVSAPRAETMARAPP